MRETLRASIESDAYGEFTAVAAAFESVAVGERGPTMFAPSAFDATVARRPVTPLLWQHLDREPIGTATLRVERDVGLMLHGRIVLASARGAEAFALIKAGAVTACSIGFTPGAVASAVIGGRTVRIVHAADVAEVSLVTFPADDAARVRTIHAAGHVAGDSRSRFELARECAKARFPGPERARLGPARVRDVGPASAVGSHAGRLVVTTASAAWTIAQLRELADASTDPAERELLESAMQAFVRRIPAETRAAVERLALEVAAVGGTLQ
jgi:HK97 family phage prohead protease